MKKSQFPILIALTLTLLLAVSTVSLRAQTVDPDAEQAERLAQAAAQGGGILETLERIREAQSQQLEGSWDITVTINVPPGAPQPPPNVTHATFSRGGGVFGSDRLRPFSKQHGAWEHLGGHRFASTRTEDIFDAMGNFAGTFKVNLSLTMTGRDEFVGVASVEFRDAAGNITRTACATVRAARIKVESLSDQCKSITPPQ